jgi:predicted dehydrogenase
MRAPQKTSRRGFLAAAASAFAFPAIVPSTVFGAAAPSDKIALGCIGVCRMGTGDMRESMGFNDVRVVAVCDVDSKRAERAKQLVDKTYSDTGCAAYADFRELLARDDIDAVQIATPDHWHAIPAVAAAEAGKDVFLQKPMSFSIAEGRAISEAVRRCGRIFQLGSQQRSEEVFRRACELVRNGRIGKVHTVKVGLTTDPPMGNVAEMPVPPNLDYDFWLGPAPFAPYHEERVHPQANLGRPGWLRILDYGAGMITGWGAHHNDIAQWGLGTEYSGPIEIEGRAEFPRDGLWDVHGNFSIDYTYANGVVVNCSNKNREGVTFEGDGGWIFVTRGIWNAEPKSLLREIVGSEETRLYVSNNHKGNWFDCMRSRRETIAPAEIGHRSNTVCLLGQIAMQLQRKLRWDPGIERFPDDPEANRLIARPMRAPWRV